MPLSTYTFVRSQVYSVPLEACVQLRSIYSCIVVNTLTGYRDYTLMLSLVIQVCLLCNIAYTVTSLYLYPWGACALTGHMHVLHVHSRVHMYTLEVYVHIQCLYTGCVSTLTGLYV